MSATYATNMAAMTKRARLNLLSPTIRVKRPRFHKLRQYVRIAAFVQRQRHCENAPASMLSDILLNVSTVSIALDHLSFCHMSE